MMQVHYTFSLPAKKIQINHAGTILCSAIGFPLPEIKWKRPDGRDINSTNMFVLPSGALKITRMMYEDAGEYICTAENVFGSVSHQFSIKVTGVGR